MNHHSNFTHLRHLIFITRFILQQFLPDFYYFQFKFTPLLAGVVAGSLHNKTIFLGKKNGVICFAEMAALVHTEITDESDRLFPGQ